MAAAILLDFITITTVLSSSYDSRPSDLVLSQNDWDPASFLYTRFHNHHFQCFCSYLIIKVETCYSVS